jgi:hypothetical protein
MARVWYVIRVKGKVVLVHTVWECGERGVRMILQL